MSITKQQVLILIFGFCLFHILITNQLHGQKATIDMQSFQDEFANVEDQQIMYMLYDSAEKYRYSNYEVAVYYISRGISLAQEYNEKELEADFWNSKGLLWSSKFETDKAIKCFLSAIAAYRETTNTIGLAYAYLNLGANNNVDTIQYKYYNLALKYFIENNHDLGIGRAYNNLGVVFLDHFENLDSAWLYFDIALEKFEKIDNKEGIAAIYTNMGEIYLKTLEYKLALEYFNNSIRAFKEVGHTKGVAHSLSNIGNLYLQMQKYDLSLAYLDSSEQIAKDLGFTEKLSEIYKCRSSVFDSLGNYQKALFWNQQYTNKIQQLSKQQNQDKVLSLQKEFEIAEKLREIEILEKNKRTNRIIQFGLILIFLLVSWISIIIYRKQKFKVKKMRIIQAQNEKIARTEKDLMEVEIRNSEMEKQLLEKEVNLQSKKISGLASSVVRKNDFMDKLKQEISSLKGIDNDEDIINVMNSLLISLHQNLEVDTDQQELKMQVERNNQNFFQYLELNHPELTKGDRQLLSYVKMEIPSKTIATILNISNTSVFTKRYRLRKKLGLENEDSLNQFLTRLPF